MAEIFDYVKTAVAAIEDKKGNDIRVLNIGELSPLGDYFVLTSGNNINQVHAISDEVLQKLAEMGVHPKQIEGYQQGNWILMDYGDFMIHIFQNESRDYYKLERIWKDAPVVEM